MPRLIQTTFCDEIFLELIAALLGMTPRNSQLSTEHLSLILSLISSFISNGMIFYVGR